MTPMTRSYCCLALVFSAEASAQVFDPPPSGAGDGGARPPLFTMIVAGSDTGARSATFQGKDTESSGARTAVVGFDSRIRLSEHWMLPWALHYQALALDAQALAPVPDSVRTLQFAAGVGYRPTDAWMFLTQLTPTWYRLSDGGRDVGLSGLAVAMWNKSPTLRWLFGLRIDPDSDLKLLPIVGADWFINDRWELKAVVPAPKLLFTLTPRARVYLGADLVGSTFRTSNTLRDPLLAPRYHDALATYRDVRLGAGLTVNFSSHLGLDLGGGYSMSRRLDYTRFDETVHFRRAPYGALTLRFSF